MNGWGSQASKYCEHAIKKVKILKHLIAFPVDGQLQAPYYLSSSDLTISFFTIVIIDVGPMDNPAILLFSHHY